MTLTLEKARREGRLNEFIRQQEKWLRGEGYDPAKVKDFERLAEALITAPPPEDQTSRSRDGDD